MTDWAKLQTGMQAGEEYKGPEFSTLPKGAWVLVQPVTSEDSSWGPALDTIDSGSDEESGRTWDCYLRFGVGLRAIGGDKLCNPTHLGAYARFKASINPTEKDPNGAIISGKLTAFLNAIFASGIDGDSARGAASFKVIKAAAEKTGMEEDQFDSAAEFLASAARQAIIDGAPRQLLIKIGHRKFKTESDSDGEKTGVAIEVRLVEDATAELMAQHKVAVFDNAKEVAAESAGTTF